MSGPALQSAALWRLRALTGVIGNALRLKEEGYWCNCREFEGLWSARKNRMQAWSLTVQKNRSMDESTNGEETRC